MNTCDWAVGEKVVCDLSSLPPSTIVREVQFSLDGEQVAFILGEQGGGFSIGVRGSVSWDEGPYENLRNLSFLAGGGVFCLVCREFVWSIKADSRVVGEYDFLWSPIFNSKGSYAVCARREGSYFLVVDGIEWKGAYPLLTEHALAEDAPVTCASVQRYCVEERDLTLFREGTFSVSVDGEVWEKSFTGVWNPSVDAGGGNVAAVIRIEGERCGVIQNGEVWDTRFDHAWDMTFSPQGGLFVTGKQGRKWYLFADDTRVWERGFFQMWKPCVSANGCSVATVVAPEFGRFTVCVNEVLWKNTYSVVEDIELSPDGERVAAVVCREYPPIKVGIHPPRKKLLVLNDKVLGEEWEHISYVTFSPDSSHLAWVGRRGKREYLIIDGMTFPGEFLYLWPPIFDQDSSHILIRGRQDNRYVRIVSKIS